MIIRGERNGRGGKNREIGIDVYTVLYVKQVINKNLLYSTGNFYSIFCNGPCGKRMKKKVNICITDSTLCIPKTHTTLYITYTPIKFFFKNLKNKDQNKEKEINKK